MTYILLTLGLLLLIVGAELLVRGAVGVAQRFKVSPLLIGVTIVAWGTSSPELVVSVDAAIRGSPGIAVGNAVGSNIFNVLLILGLVAVIRPILCSPQAIYRDGSYALIAALLFILVAWFVGTIATWMGIAMLLILAGMVYLTFRQERVDTAAASAELHRKEAAQVHAIPTALWLNIVFVAAGLATLVFGADFLVQSAIEIARGFGVSETIIGLTLVAAGTSLPELATSAVAAVRRQADVSLGNIIGSNIYNILAILGVAALFGPVPVPPEIVAKDMWIMLAATLLLLPPVFMGYRIGRTYGVFFLCAYVGYVLLLFAGIGRSAGT
jgi:cation:H+ antiporter